MSAALKSKIQITMRPLSVQPSKTVLMSPSPGKGVNSHEPAFNTGARMQGSLHE